MRTPQPYTGRAVAVLALLLAAAAPARAQSVITASPDPAHPILSQPFQDATNTLSESRLTSGNRFELLENGASAFPRMLDLARTARVALFSTTMVISYDAAAVAFIDELVAAAGRGVDVRCIYDGQRSDPRAIRRLRRGGCNVTLYNGFFDGDRKGRMHEKLLVRDFDAMVIGGMNLADEYLYATGNDERYKDTAVFVEGYAAIEAARSFLELSLALEPVDPVAWGYLVMIPSISQPQPVAAGRAGYARHILQESDLGDDHISAYYRRCFDAAQAQIVWHVNNLAPVGDLYAAARAAAARGVRVVIVTNSKTAYIRRHGIVGFFQYWGVELLYRRRLRGSGIELWEIDTPLHSKALTVDGVMASIGSFNFSRTSQKNLEGTAVIYDPALVRSVEEMFERDLGRARRTQ